MTMKVLLLIRECLVSTYITASSAYQEVENVDLEIRQVLSSNVQDPNDYEFCNEPI